MHIVHSIATLDFVQGGPVRAVIDLSNAMTARGHRVSVLTKRAPDRPEEWAGRGESPFVVELGEPNKLKVYYKGDPLEKIRERIAQAELVHIHGIWSPHNTQIAREAHKQGKPYVISCRGMLDDWCMDQRRLKKKVYLALAHGSWMLNNARRIHCTAEGELSQSKKWFPQAQGVVIPNLLDLAAYENMPGPGLAEGLFDAFSAGLPVLLYLSRIHYKKGIEHAIEAVRVLEDRDDPHMLLIAGTGDETYEYGLRRQVKELGLDHRVRFIGMIVGEEKLSLYQASDVFVLPTSQENFGFVLYEALASGTPLITTKGVDTWPELEQAGSTVVSQSATAIADAIGLLTSDPAALKTRGQQGRDWVFREMSSESVADRFEAMYRDVAPH